MLEKTVSRCLLWSRGWKMAPQAILFDQWLIPFDDVLKTFNLTAALQPDGQLSLSSPEITTNLRLESLPTDPGLGVMWSIADIRHHLGASAEFDRASYAIRFNLAAMNRSMSDLPVGSRDVNGSYASLESLLPESYLRQTTASAGVQSGRCSVSRCLFK